MKLLDTPTLIRANQLAIEQDQNRQLDPEFLEDQVDEHGTHVISFAMHHVNFEGTVGIRCRILIKRHGTMEPAEAWLDMDPGLYERLAIYEGTGEN